MCSSGADVPGAGMYAAASRAPGIRLHLYRGGHVLSDCSLHWGGGAHPSEVLRGQTTGPRTHSQTGLLALHTLHESTQGEYYLHLALHTLHESP